MVKLYKVVFVHLLFLPPGIHSPSLLNIAVSLVETVSSPPPPPVRVFLVEFTPRPVPWGCVPQVCLANENVSILPCLAQANEIQGDFC